MFWIVIAVLIFIVVVFLKKDKLRLWNKIKSFESNEIYKNEMLKARKIKTLLESVSFRVEFASSNYFIVKDFDANSKKLFDEKNSDIIFVDAHIDSRKVNYYLWDLYNNESAELKELRLNEFITNLFGKTISEIESAIKAEDLINGIYFDSDMDPHFRYSFKCPCGLTGDDKELFIKAVSQQ